ncbi:MAG: hypothetical protein ACTSSG_13455 [Candidatus Heimdallarchaeaceae archaeon]
MIQWRILAGAISIGIICTGLGVTIGFFVFRSNTQNDETAIWQKPPEGWHEIGVPMIDDFQQTQSFGDFSGDGKLEMIGSYSHTQVGIFRHFRENENAEWQVETLHPRFDHQGDSSYTWPVKGLENADVDGDGYQELVSLADIVYYPPNHGGKGRSFPGAIYIDPNEKASWEPKPLFYGAWAENLTGGIMVIPSFVPRTFSGSMEQGYHILLSCNRALNNKYYGHVYLLEQPEEGFYPYDYRYVTKNITGTEPYNQEPFYLKRLWLYNNISDSYNELFWDPGEVTNSNSVQARAMVTNLYSESSGLDLVMWGTFRDRFNSIITSKLVFYQRIVGDENHKYAFEEKETWWAAGVEFWPAKRANLDGNPSNGKEAIVVGLANHVPHEGIGLNGFFYLTEESGAGNWELKTIDFKFDWSYPYRWIYSEVQVLDYNQDGFDDVAVYAIKNDWPAPSWGDLVVFQNIGESYGSIISGKSRFNVSEIHPIVLWSNDSFNWDIDVSNVVGDSNNELIVSLARRDPYVEGSNSGAFKVFYYQIG